MQGLPVARATQLLVTEADGETLVYDLASHEAHALDAAAALVWRSCDGTRSAGDLAQLLRTEGGIATADEAMATYTLGLLEDLRLLEVPAHDASSKAPVSRRAMLRRAASAGIVMVGVPTILSVVAPTTAYALTSCKGKPCNSDFECCAGSKCVGNGVNPVGFCQ